jgi:predicted methyltransferase
MPLLRGPVPLSHLFIRQCVKQGDCVIDATCGNGHDTLLLANLVGQTGRVWAFDIQQQAVEATAARLTAAGGFDTVSLIHGSHERMAEQCHGPVTAIVFNLGYLPGGDRNVITRPETTLAGVEQSLELLAPGGIVAITVYPGHEGGDQERTALEERVSQLSPGSYHVWRMAQINVSAEAPYCVLIQKVL